MGDAHRASFLVVGMTIGGTGIFRNVLEKVHVESIVENRKTLLCNFRVTYKLPKAADGQGHWASKKAGNQNALSRDGHSQRWK